MTALPTVAACQAAIERVLFVHGGESFAYVNTRARTQIILGFPGFTAAYDIALPALAEQRFQLTPAGRKRRSQEAAFAEWQKECLHIWQAITGLILAKFAAIDEKLTTIMHEFSLHRVVPAGELLPAEGTAGAS